MLPKPSLLEAAQAALRASEASRTAFLETSLDGVITIDHQGVVLDFNPAAETIFGWTKQEAVGQEMAELIIPAEYRARHRLGLQRATQTGEDTIIGHRIEITALRRSGEVFPCELAIARIVVNSGLPCFTGHIRDITQRKQAESEMKRLNAELTERVTLTTRHLAESQEVFYKAFHSNPAAMTLSRVSDRRFVDVNAAFCFGTEHSREQTIGRTPDELGVWIEGPGRDLFYQELMTKGAVKEMEITFRSNTGRIDHVLLSGEVMEFMGEPHLLTVAIDINARRQAEAELRQAFEREKELSDLKSSFVTLVSHEFRTPLGVIMSAADILEAYFERLTPEQRSEQLLNIHEASRRMADLMEEVLLLGRVESGKMQCKPEPILPAEWLHRIVDEMRSATNQKCQFVIETTPEARVRAYADDALLRHIFTNLLSNGAKYSPQGSEVVVSLGREETDAIFEVRDAGIGVPEEDLAMLFEAFHRGRNVGGIAGTGLGLTIVKRCVDLHGGQISVRNGLERGTIVQVRMPIFREGAAEA